MTKKNMGVKRNVKWIAFVSVRIFFDIQVVFWCELPVLGSHCLLAANMQSRGLVNTMKTEDFDLKKYKDPVNLTIQLIINVHLNFI